MTTFIYLRSCLLVTFLLLSLQSPAQPPRPRNYVVLLDLSDRLLAPDQARRDQALILTVFDRFEQAVRQNLIINSRDRFRVVIAPQAGTSYRPEQVMASLYLDMAGSIAQKRDRLDVFKRLLPGRLQQLYRQATTGKSRPADFRGCDIWQYFNEHLATDLSASHQNLLVVLTDGYFDFEHNSHVLQQGNRFTDSHRLMADLRNRPNWQQILRQPQAGLLPVDKRFAPVQVWVTELRPKVDHLHELDLLKGIWTKWLNDMHIRQVHCLAWGSLPVEQEALRNIP